MPAQAVSQHTRSAQKVLRHSSPSTQAIPTAFWGVQTPLSHQVSVIPAQSAWPVQASQRPAGALPPVGPWLVSQKPLTQSSALSQPSPLGQSGQVPPPQSMPVSLPLTMLSSQLAGTHSFWMHWPPPSQSTEVMHSTQLPWPSQMAASGSFGSVQGVWLGITPGTQTPFRQFGWVQGLLSSSGQSKGLVQPPPVPPPLPPMAPVPLLVVDVLLEPPGPSNMNLSKSLAQATAATAPIPSAIHLICLSIADLTDHPNGPDSVSTPCRPGSSEAASHGQRPRADAHSRPHDGGALLLVRLEQVPNE